MTIHVVRSGDTLSSIAQTYGVTVEELAANNGLSPSDTLVVGQALLVLIPTRRVTVQPGDTLLSLASQAGLSVNALYRYNPQLRASPLLQPGQSLILGYDTPSRGPLSVSGYAYPNVDPQLLRETLPFITYLIPFTYGFTLEGQLIQPEDEALRDLAAEYGVDTLLHLSTLGADGRFSASLAAQLLEDPALQETLISTLIETLYARGFVGLDVDFEYVPARLSGAYAEFLQRARARLEPLGFLLFSALAPKTSDDQPGDLYQGHDYAALAAASDAVLLMTYEWGYTYSAPMAVAPIRSVSRVLDYALTRIPREKIYLGIPNYGYDWPLPYQKGVTRARSIGCQEAVDLARRFRAEIQFDEFAQTPFFRYTDGGQSHEVWFEDVRSILAKLDLVSAQNLEGIGYWNLMRPFRQNWQLLGALFQIRQ